jgi:DNA-binding SARP family transcriptional activator
LFRNRTHHREVLAGLFWGDYDEDRARGCLNTAIWRLRRVLEPAQVRRGTYLLAPPTGEIGFNRKSDYWLDVEAFESKVDHALAKPVEVMRQTDAVQVEAGLQLYIGELLEGFYYDWALQERERLSLKYAKCLGHLMDYYGFNRQYDEAIDYGKRILQSDPLREDVHREVMRLFAQSGRRNAAVRQYEQCSSILKSQLGAEPMGETRGLYDAIVKLTDTRRPSPVFSTEQAAKSLSHNGRLEKAYRTLRLAADDCDRIHARLLLVAQILERMTKE